MILVQVSDVPEIVQAGHPSRRRELGRDRNLPALTGANVVRNGPGVTRANRNRRIVLGPRRIVATQMRRVPVFRHFMEAATIDPPSLESNVLSGLWHRRWSFWPRPLSCDIRDRPIW